jgi:hypothetical protein
MPRVILLNRGVRHHENGRASMCVCIFFFFFWWIRGWIQSLTFARKVHYQLSHAPITVRFISFWDRVSLYAQASLDHHLPITLLWWLGWQVCSTIPSCYWLRWVLGNILPRLVLNSDPPDLQLLSVWDYRLEQLSQAETVPLVQSHSSGLVLWLKWLSTCVESTGHWVQTPVLQKCTHTHNNNNDNNNNKNITHSRAQPLSTGETLMTVFYPSG